MRRSNVSELHKSNLPKAIWKYRELYLLSIPGIIFLILFKYAPIYGLVLAFKEYNIGKGIMGSPWVGWDNFKALFSTNNFPTVVMNTIILSLQKLIFGFPAPIILALMLNEVIHTTLKKAVQTVSYIPHFISWVVLGSIFIELLSPRTGLFNQLIVLFGGDPIFFLAHPGWIRFVLVATEIFKEIGWGSIVYLAAITGVDPELYQAAMVDGAGRFQRMFYVTLPSITTTIIVLLILRIGQLMNAGMDQVLMMYNPNVYNKVDIIDTYVYRLAFGSFEYGLTTAAGLFKSVIACILLVGANQISKKIKDTSIF